MKKKTFKIIKETAHDIHPCDIGNQPKFKHMDDKPKRKLPPKVSDIFVVGNGSKTVKKVKKNKLLKNLNIIDINLNKEKRKRGNMKFLNKIRKKL